VARVLAVRALALQQAAYCLIVHILLGQYLDGKGRMQCCLHGQYIFMPNAGLCSDEKAPSPACTGVHLDHKAHRLPRRSPEATAPASEAATMGQFLALALARLVFGNDVGIPRSGSNIDIP